MAGVTREWVPQAETRPKYPRLSTVRRPTEIDSMTRNRVQPWCYCWLVIGHYVLWVETRPRYPRHLTMRRSTK